MHKQSRKLLESLILHWTRTRITGVIADLAAFPETNEGTFSWVNGTITNLGQGAICGVAFASRDTDLTMDALDIFPINLPTTTLDEEVFESIDLAPGESLDFAYFLPFDNARNAPAFVGLANSLHACPKALEKFVPELPEMEEVAADAAEVADAAADAANTAVDTTQEKTGGVMDTVKAAAEKLVDGTKEVSKELVEGTEEKLDAAIDAIQDLVKQPEEEVAAPADATATIPTTTDAAADAKAAAEEVTPKAGGDEPPTTELPTKEAQKEAEATSPAGTRSASGSILLLGMIAALSVVALFA